MEENVAYEIKKYSYADLLEIHDDKRYEIIDGVLYVMDAPFVTHQGIVGELYGQLREFLKGKTCKVYTSPIDVVLSKSKQENKMFNVVQPDVLVVCDSNKIEKRKIFGAPDFIVEVLSESNKSHDSFYKFNLYQKFGVREYWIIDPDGHSISPYVLNEKGNYEISKMYDITEEVPVKVLKGCKICLKDFYEENKELFE